MVTGSFDGGENGKFSGAGLEETRKLFATQDDLLMGRPIRQSIIGSNFQDHFDVFLVKLYPV